MIKIPRSLDEILPAAAMEKLLDVLHQPDIAGKVREAMNKVGLGEVGMGDTTPLDKVKVAWQQARSWLDSLAGASTSALDTPLVLNATGRLFPDSITALPMSATVAYGQAKVASNYHQPKLLNHKADLASASAFPGCEAVWISTTAEAVRLAANSPWGSKGVVTARADAVRISGIGDFRAMLAQSQHTLVDIGAANGVTPQDWSAAVTEPQQIVFLCSPNGLTAADARDQRRDALRSAKAVGAKVIELLADGVVSPSLATELGLPEVQQHLASGTDAVILPMQMLLGGPGGALVVGSSELVRAIRAAAEPLGCLMSGPQLVAATMALQMANLSNEIEAGIPAQLLANPENLKNRSQRLAIQLAGIGEISAAEEVECITPLGASPWNRYVLHGWSVKLIPKTSLHELKRQLTMSGAGLSIHLLFTEEENSILIDLRFVAPQHDHDVVLAATGLPKEKDAQTGTS